MPPASVPPSPRYRLLAAAVVMLALLVRTLYVWMGSVEYPIRGDVNQYVLYAWNMSHRGTFSTALPDAAEPVPDSYRNPGYPAFLAAAMLAAGHADLPLRAGPGASTVLGYDSDTWMRIALAAQVLLGTLTVWLVMLLGRLWLPAPASLGAGLVTALWPHLVTFSGVLLSETLFAFALTASLLLLVVATAAGSTRRVAFAGLAWGLTCLINPIVALFPLIVAPFVGRKSARLAWIFLAAFALLPGLWAARNALETKGRGSAQRIEENFVQGSWPQYLAAYNTRFGNDISRRIVAAAGAEVKLLEASPSRGIREIASRMALDPPYYLKWYLIDKPFLLWDWHIRIGAGDIYFLPVGHSAFERIPLLRAVATFLRWCNPLVFLLAGGVALASVVLAVAGRRRTGFAVLALGLCAVYLTGVHAVLQAEPRYSIPYRPIEILLAATALAWMHSRLAALGQAPATARRVDVPV